MNFKSVYVSGLLAVWPVIQGMAQSELIKFGDFDQWIVRNIKESGIIGGDTKQLYEIGPDAVWNENKAYTNQGGSPWATSNVMAKVWESPRRILRFTGRSGETVIVPAWRLM